MIELSEPDKQWVQDYLIGLKDRIGRGTTPFERSLCDHVRYESTDNNDKERIRFLILYTLTNMVTDSLNVIHNTQSLEEMTAEQLHHYWQPLHYTSFWLDNSTPEEIKHHFLKSVFFTDSDNYSEEGRKLKQLMQKIASGIPQENFKTTPHVQERLQNYKELKTQLRTTADLLQGISTMKIALSKETPDNWDQQNIYYGVGSIAPYKTYGKIVRASHPQNTFDYGRTLFLSNITLNPDLEEVLLPPIEKQAKTGLISKVLT